MFTSLKVRNIALFYLNLFAGTGILGNARRTGAYGKSAKAAKLDTVAVSQRVSNLIKDYGYNPLNVFQHQMRVFVSNTFN